MSGFGPPRRVGRLVALPLAALVLATCATAVIARPEPDRPVSQLSSAAGGFTITSEIFSTPSGDYPAQSCSGIPSLLYPGVTRCAVFTVRNNESVPITVTGITSALDTASSGLPDECTGSNLTLPVFSGSLTVAAGSSSSTSGVPVELKESGTNQDACKGLTYDFVYSGTAQYAAGPFATTTALLATPSISAAGGAVVLTATVTSAIGTGAPTGTVSFYVSTLTTSRRLLGSSPVTGSATASLVVTTLPAGSDNLYAVYGGSADHAGSSSPGSIHSVVLPPGPCALRYSTSVFGDPKAPVIQGTSGSDFVRAVGGSFIIKGSGGNDCLVTGNGRDTILGGGGSDVIISGNGEKTVFAGDGYNRIILGKGRFRVITGSGSDRVTIARASGSSLRLGDGNDYVAIGSGSGNRITLGNGRNTVRIASRGGYNTIRTGRGVTHVYLGGGTHNVFIGGRRGNICHLPKPPRSWRGTPAAYFHDTLINCRVVTS